MKNALLASLLLTSLVCKAADPEQSPAYQLPVHPPTAATDFLNIVGATTFSFVRPPLFAMSWLTLGMGFNRCFRFDFISATIFLGMSAVLSEVNKSLCVHIRACNANTSGRLQSLSVGFQDTVFGLSAAATALVVWNRVLTK
jgi:hypothetical protein